MILVLALVACSGTGTDCVLAGDASCNPFLGALQYTARTGGTKVPRFVYVANLTAGTISRYTVSAQGLLTYLGDTVTGASPRGITVDPAGSYLYVGSSTTQTVYAYAIQTSGDLNFIGSVATTGGNGPWDLVVHPNGLYLYASNSDAGTGNTITRFNLSNGLPVFNSLTASGGLQPAGMVIDATGGFLYSAMINGPTGVGVWQLFSDGSLTYQYSVSTCASTNVYEIAMDPARRFIYAGLAAGPPGCVYTLSAPGNLSSAGSFSHTSAFDSGLEFNTAGDKVFFTDNSGTLVTFVVDPSTGLPASNGTSFATAGTNGRSIAVDPTGRFVFVLNNAGSLSAYTTDPTTGFIRAQYQQLTAGSGSRDLVIVSLAAD